MKIFSFVFYLLLFFSCNQNSKPINVYIESYGWQLQIPKGWKVSTKIENAYWENRGTKVLKEKVNRKIDTKSFVPVIQLNSGLGSLNMFVATHAKFDPVTDKNYEFSRKMRNWAYKQVYKGRVGIKIKTKEFPITIDELKFEAEYIEVFKNDKMIMKQISLERMYENQDILIIQCVGKPDYYDDMFNAFLKSKFDRKI